LGVFPVVFAANYSMDYVFYFFALIFAAAFVITLFIREV
jgi:hypothetical protein